MAHLALRNKYGELAGDNEHSSNDNTDLIT